MRYHYHAVLCLMTLGALACTGDEPETVQADTNSPEAVEARCAGSLAPVVTAGGIGPVRIGSRPSELAERCPVRDTTLSLEGMSEQAVLVRVAGGSVIAQAAGRDSIITRIIVVDTSYRTERGVGVGSTVGDLRLGHGRICAAAGEGEIVASAAQMPGISFATAARPGEFPRAENDASLLPDSTRITRLWIYDGPALCGGS